MPLSVAEKTLENRLRRQAERLGLRVEKSRSRRFSIKDHGLWRLLTARDHVIAGECWDLTLESLENMLNDLEAKSKHGATLTQRTR